MAIPLCMPELKLLMWLVCDFTKAMSHTNQVGKQFSYCVSHLLVMRLLILVTRIDVQIMRFSVLEEGDRALYQRDSTILKNFNTRLRMRQQSWGGHTLKILWAILIVNYALYECRNSLSSEPRTATSTHSLRMTRYGYITALEVVHWFFFWSHDKARDTAGGFILLNWLELHTPSTHSKFPIKCHVPLEVSLPDCSFFAHFFFRAKCGQKGIQ